MDRDESGSRRLPLAYRGLGERAERLAGPGSSDRAGPLERLAAEGARLQDMLDRATPPDVMSRAAVAPARGPMALEPEYAINERGFRKVVGHHFREILVLELICIRASERHKASRTNEAFVAPFSFQQIEIAAQYRELVKRRQGGGIKCSSLEPGRAGGGGSGLFIESFMDQGRALAYLHDMIGTGIALAAGQEGRLAGRRDILDRELIDRVVLQDMQLPEVLRRFGWSDGGRVKARAQEALRRILDRMLGNPAKNEGA